MRTRLFKGSGTALLVTVSLLLTACAGEEAVDDSPSPAADDGLAGGVDAGDTAGGDVDQDATGDQAADDTEPANFTITSSAFERGDPVPVEYTCDGDDTSPPLSWGPAPEGTASFTIIVDDPDAPNGTWVHWNVFDVPPEVTSIGADEVPPADRIGENDFGNVAYGGPCPPAGETHTYRFTVLAMAEAGVAAGDRMTLEDFRDQAGEAILAESTLTADFLRN